MMKDQDFSVSISVKQTPQTVFDAINNIRAWWSDNITGSTDQLNSVFIYQDKYLQANIKITQLSIHKIVWDVLETDNAFFKNNKEWDGTRIIFDIKSQGGAETILTFTHAGLTPQFECYNICSNSWTFFITTSLKSLIETGKGKEISTDEHSYCTSFVVDKSPEEVFEAINNVRGWWSAAVEGDTQALHATFLYYYRDVHLSKMEIVESIPYKRIVWFVKDNFFNFTQNKSEWKGNKIIFEITQEADSPTTRRTKLTFTHHGLTARNECYEVCEKSWTSYINGSLKSLITTGLGSPNSKEAELNSAFLDQWRASQ